MALDNGGTYPLSPAPTPLVDPSPLSVERNETTTAIFPNPARDMVNVDLSLQTAGTVEVNVWNANGQLIQRRAFNNLDEGYQRLNVDVRSLPSGAYYLQVTTTDENITQPLQIMK